MKPAGTFRRKTDSDKDAQKKSDVSLERDFFVIVMGLLLTLLIFALFALVSGRGFEIIFPRSRRTLIGDDGAALDFISTKFVPGVAREYIQIGIVLGSIALVVFICVFVVLHWIKKEDQPEIDQPDPAPRNPASK